MCGASPRPCAGAGARVDGIRRGHPQHGSRGELGSVHRRRWSARWLRCSKHLGGWRLAPERKALLCQKAENEFVGVNCGILDQYSSCLGREGCALLLDCRDLSTRAVWIAERIRTVVCNTMSQRRLSGGEYAQRRAECEQGAAVLGVGALREVTPRMLAARRQRTSGAGRQAMRIHRCRERAGRVDGPGACLGRPGGRGRNSARSRLRAPGIFTRSARPQWWP